MTATAMDQKPAYPVSVISPMEPQASRAPAPESRTKLYAVVLVIAIAALGVTAIVLGVVLLHPRTPSQVFHVTIENDLRPIPVEIELDSKAKVEFVVVPALADEGNNDNVTATADSIYILRDYNKGISAHKDTRSNTCYIGKLGMTFEERQRLLSDEGPQLRFNGTRRFVALNDTIDPEVLSFTAGHRIASFCHPLTARWIVEGHDPSGASGHRAKRFFWWWWNWGCCRCNCYPVCYGWCYRSCIYGC